MGPMLSHIWGIFSSFSFSFYVPPIWIAEPAICLHSLPLPSQFKAFSSHQRINYDLSCLPYPFPLQTKKNQGKNNEDLPRLSRFKRCTVISTKPLPSVHTPDSFEALIEGKSWCFFFIYRNKGCFL